MWRLSLGRWGCISFYESKKMDHIIIALTEYEPILLQSFSVDGSVHAFETKCLKKKIPYLIVRFPSQENTTRKRQQQRQLVCLETPIILDDFRRKVAGEKVAGMGTILDISDGGCSIDTKIEVTSTKRSISS